jgi:hypothetical protein
MGYPKLLERRCAALSGSCGIRKNCPSERTAAVSRVVNPGHLSCGEGHYRKARIVLFGHAQQVPQADLPSARSITRGHRPTPFSRSRLMRKYIFPHQWSGPATRYEIVISSQVTKRTESLRVTGFFEKAIRPRRPYWLAAVARFKSMNDRSFSRLARPSERLSKSGAWHRVRSTVLLWFSENRTIARKYRGLEKKSPWRMFSACPVDMEVQRSMRQIAPNNAFCLGFKGAGERFWKRRWRREWDSNPRYGLPYTRFPSERLQPLGHPSGHERNIATGPGVTTRAAAGPGGNGGTSSA